MIEERKIEITPNLVARFFGKVAVAASNQCWEWKAGKSSFGYGAFTVGQDTLPATHIALAIAGQNRGVGQNALHHCDNPACCNPKHLYWGTQKENSRDCKLRGRDRKRGLIGSANSQAKLNEDDIRAIRKSPLGVMALARQYGVTHGAIHKIIYWKTWAHIV